MVKSLKSEWLRIEEQEKMNKKKIAICLSVVVLLAIITYYAGNYFYIQSLPKLAIEISNVNITISNMTASFTVKNIGFFPINKITLTVIDVPLQSTPINCSLPTFASINVNFVFTIMTNNEALNNGIAPYSPNAPYAPINQTIRGAIVSVYTNTPDYSFESSSYYLNSGAFAFYN